MTTPTTQTASLECWNCGEERRFCDVREQRDCCARCDHEARPVATPTTLTVGELAAALRELGTGDSDDFKLFELCANNLPTILAALEDAERLRQLQQSGHVFLRLMPWGFRAWAEWEPLRDGVVKREDLGDVNTLAQVVERLDDAARRGEGQ